MTWGHKASAPPAARLRAAAVACIATLLLALLAGGATGVRAGIGDERSDVVLVFDVSNSILLSRDDTNVEFADALDEVADRVDAVADDLAAGHAVISFVAFGRQAISYPANCSGLDLNGDPAAIQRFETCLRAIATDYRDGSVAAVAELLETQDTDHVAALTRAAELLPASSNRAAVVFFTDGQHDPPGTSRDGEDVVARVTPAFEGVSPLAVLPVGLGPRAGEFETQLTAIYQAFFRDMQPCPGRGSFTWPEVVFPSADAAGAAVALALQEVTCSFTVAPTPVPPSSTPAATVAPPDAPTGVRVLAGDRSLTVQWLPPAAGEAGITGYVVSCTPAAGGDPVVAEVGVSTELEAEIGDLPPGAGYQCTVAAKVGTSTGAPSAPSEVVVVLGIPATPGQPRAEPRDNAALLTVDPVVSGAPVESYVFECTSAGGAKTLGVGPTSSVVVGNLVNGESFTCVAYAENRIGRSPASPASAAFSPCGGLFQCNPWAIFVVAAVTLLAIVATAVFGTRMYRRRNRVWVTAQVDGGENLPLGWGPELGVMLERDTDGWYATSRPHLDAPIKVRYTGKNRFMVNAGGRFTDVHQGDPAPVRDPEGAPHQLILRRYRSRPSERRAAAKPPAAAPVDAAATAELEARIEGREGE